MTITRRTLGNAIGTGLTFDEKVLLDAGFEMGLCLAFQHREYAQALYDGIMADGLKDAPFVAGMFEKLMAALPIEPVTEPMPEENL